MGQTERYDEMGIALTYPDEMENTKGVFGPLPMGGRGDGTYFMLVSYIAIPKEELEAADKNNKDGKPDEAFVQKVMTGMGGLLTVAGIDGGRGPAEIIRSLKSEKMKEEMFTEVGRTGDITYYAITNPESDEAFVSRVDQVYAEEFRYLQKKMIEVLKQAEYFTPRIPGSEFVGKTVTFETKDVSGNPVNSKELFAQHQITMINFWATWCGPCKSELEELGNIHRRLSEKDAAVVGICTDAGEHADACRTLTAEKNLTYLNILPDAKIEEELGIDSIPTTFFIDREGKILTPPVIGVPADISLYEKTVDGLLAGKDASAGTSGETMKTCRVTVKDTEGNPVSDVSVQFCSGTLCMMKKTDQNGTASFERGEGKSDVHVLKVPEGYEACAEGFEVTDDSPDVEITLKKEN